MSSVARELSAMGVPGLRVAASQGERSLYTRDQSEIPRFMKDIMFRSLPEAVVQPSFPEAVAAVLRFASSRGLTVVPRGSASSPFGGSVPVLGGLVLDTSRMNRILEVDPRAKTVTVEAGARWAEVDHALERHGLTLHTYPSSRFSTVAGWLSTGGMGINSLSKGHVCESVEMVELVTVDGVVRHLSHEDPLFHAVFGSEGQLGVITAVKLRVRERPTFMKPHLLLFDELDAAVRFAVSLARSDVYPAHILYEGPGKFPYMNRSIGGEHFRSAHAILVSIEGTESESAFRRFAADAGAIEEREYLARYLWNERFFPMKVRRFGPGMLGSEVVVDIDSLGRTLSEAERLCRQLDIDPLFEVHFISGGKALLLCYFVTDQGNTIRYTLDAAKSMLVTSALLDLGAKPYSIGVWNNPFSGEVDRTRLAALRAAKHSLDPRGIMNAGKMFGLSGRFGGLFGALFGPTVLRPVLRVAVLWSPLTSKLMRPAYRFAERRLRPKTRRELLRIADECAMCGACVSVCPAYLVVGDERVTARGKLLTLKEIARGADISKEHAHRMFLCMRCKACEQVCQSKLALVDAYEMLERELEALYGKDVAEIERFVRYAESTPDYDRLIDQGLVLGAPKHGMGGGRADV